MIGVGIVVAGLFWVLEAAIHALVWRTATFSQALLPSDPNELWMRVLTCLLFVLFGAYVHRGHARLRRMQEERDVARGRLESALTKVLAGFIPICASCKQVRVEPDRWVQVESYVGDHSEAQFSHTICPPCRERLYPGLGKRTQGPPLRTR
jgi:hypothetical protein